jgi:hypothetical protein
MPVDSDTRFAAPGEHQIRHSVAFYQGDQYPSWSLAHYFKEGLEREESALVVATDAHARAIFHNLSSLDVEVDLLREMGVLQHLNANEMLEDLLSQGEFDREKAFLQGNELVEKVLRASPVRQMRMMGEVSPLLVKRGKSLTALELEQVWNELQGFYPFQIYCAYEESIFATGDALDKFCAICGEHDVVIPNMPTHGSQTPPWLTLLQEQASFLRREVLQRKRAERYIELKEEARLEEIEKCMKSIGPMLSPGELEHVSEIVSRLCEEAVEERAASLPNTPEWYKRTGEILGYGKLIVSLGKRRRLF